MQTRPRWLSGLSCTIYLYDWHKKGTFHGIRRLFEMHGFSHPGRACVNAEQVFHITKKEQSIISSHMWPLTFRHVPSCREAIIVCLADKYCAVVESMFKHSRVAAAKTPTANTTSGKIGSLQITGAAAPKKCSGSFSLYYIRREKADRENPQIFPLCK